MWQLFCLLVLLLARPGETKVKWEYDKDTEDLVVVDKITEQFRPLERIKDIAIRVPICMEIAYVLVVFQKPLIMPTVNYNKNTQIVKISYERLSHVNRSKFEIIAKGSEIPQCNLLDGGNGDHGGHGGHGGYGGNVGHDVSGGHGGNGSHGGSVGHGGSGHGMNSALGGGVFGGGLGLPGFGSFYVLPGVGGYQVLPGVSNGLGGGIYSSVGGVQGGGFNSRKSIGGARGGHGGWGRARGGHWGWGGARGGHGGWGGAR